MTPAAAKRLAAVERPATVDSDGLIEIVAELEGWEPSVETVRRWEIPYRLVGRKRHYDVDRAIAYVRQRYEQAPVRVATPSGSRKRAKCP
jgi:hypothetical protein